MAGGQLSVNLNIDQMHHFIKIALQGKLAVSLFGSQKQLIILLLLIISQLHIYSQENLRG